MNRAYTGCMTVIANGRPVPTPEEMAEILGVSAERLEAVRRIMDTPVRSRRKSVHAKPSSMSYSRRTKQRAQKKVR